MKFDPAMIKLGIFALVFLVKAISSMNNKRKKSNDALRPPQSVSAPPPIGSPTMKQSAPPINQPPMSGAPRAAKGKSSSDDSPWSSTQNPFD